MNCDDMLRLYKVCHIAFSIDPSDNESSSRSSTIFFRDKCKFNLFLAVHLKWLDIEITENARDLEGCVLEMLKIFEEIVIEDEIRLISNTVWVLKS